MAGANDGIGRECVLPLAVCELLCDGLPRARSLDDALQLLERARGMAFGAGLLTVNLDVTTPQDPPGDIRLRRIWSSQPGTYPVGGGKTKTRTPWTRQLLEQGQVFVGEGDAALASVFEDHARIASLGLRAVVNVPLLRQGRCVATFNVLGPGAHWQPGQVAAARLLGLLATPHVLCWLDVGLDGEFRTHC